MRAQLLFLSVLSIGCRAAPTGTDGTITAQRFLLVDKTGATRAELGPQSGGDWGLVLYGSDATIRLLTGQDGSAALLLADRYGRARSIYTLSADGSARLNFFNEHEVPLVDLSVDGLGRFSSLRFLDKQKKVRTTIGVLMGDHPSIAVTGSKEGEPPIFSVGEIDSGPYLIFYDLKEKLLWCPKKNMLPAAPAKE